MQSTGRGDKAGEPAPVVAGEDARIAPPPVVPEAGGLAGDIRPPAPKAGQTVEVPVQAGDEGRPDAVAEAQAEIATAGEGPAEKVAPVSEPLEIVGADPKQTARDAVVSSLGGDHGGLEAAVSVTPDPDEGEQLTQPTAVEVKAPEVAKPVAEEFAPAPTEGGVLAGFVEPAEPLQSKPQPAPEPAEPTQPPALAIPYQIPPDQGPAIEAATGEYTPENPLDEMTSEQLKVIFNEVFWVIPTMQQEHEKLIVAGKINEAKELQNKIKNRLDYARVLSELMSERKGEEVKAEQLKLNRGSMATGE